MGSISTCLGTRVQASDGTEGEKEQAGAASGSHLQASKGTQREQGQAGTALGSHFQSQRHRGKEEACWEGMPPRQWVAGG